MRRFSLNFKRLGVDEAGSIQSVENTADDAVVTVGEDEEPTAVLQGWVVTGSGQISVTVGGGTKGLLTHVEAGGLTFTGTVAEVNVWLQGVRYRYSTTAQSQTGDNDTITLTFTPLDQAGQPGGPSIVATQDILVAPQNDAPVVGKNGQTIARVHEGGTLSFGAPESVGEGFVHALLGISDPDNLAEQVIIRLESIPDPVHGYLELTRGSQTMTLAAGSTFSVQELGNLRYVHTGVQVSPANGASTPLQSFSFTIDDGAGARLPNQTVSIELLPVNQAPGVAGGVVIIEGEPGPAGYGVSLGAGGMLPVIGGARGAIQGVDPDDSTLTYQIAGLPTYGTLYYNGVELTAENIASIDITDLDKLTYRYSDEHEPGVGSHGTHAAGEAGRDTFLIRVKDSGGGAGADAALESTPVEVRLTILENNDDPYFDMVLPAPDADGKITLATLHYETEKQEGSNTILITEDMLPLKDTDSFDVNLVFTITGSNADPVGYFTVDGKLLNVAEGKSASFTYRDVADGKVKYHFLSAGTEERIDYIEFTVRDSAITVLFDEAGNGEKRDGGIYVGPGADANLRVFRLEVRVPAGDGEGSGVLPGMPEIPSGFSIGGNLTFTLFEGAGTSAGSDGHTLTAADLETTDGVSPPQEIVYRLETAPASGTLYRDGVALKQFDSFTQEDINEKRVVFRHAGGEHFTDSFQFSVSNGSITTDSLSTFNIVVTPQNDTPSASQAQIVNVLEGGEITINGGGVRHIVLADSDANVEGAGGYANDNALHFVITALPQHGTLYRVVGESRTQVEVGDIITQAELDGGKLVYEHNGTENFTDGFRIQPYDDQNVGLEGGSPADSTNHSSKGAEALIQITVVPVNDPPEWQETQHLENEHALYEGEAAIIWGENPANPGEVYGQLIFTDSDNSKVADAVPHHRGHPARAALQG